MTGDLAFPAPRRDQLDRDVAFSRDTADVAGLAKGLLEQVLEQTPSNAPSEADRALLDALTEIARRHQRRELSRDPILVDLLQEVLVRQFPRSGTAGSWRSIAEKIATTLFEDPESHRRLARFWTRLSERVQ
jgi:hypothetical protein